MNVPKLRFKEFDGEWEENNLKKLLSLLKDGTHGTHKDVLEGPYLLSAKNIINGAIRISENDRKISMEEFNSIYKNYELRKGDVLLSIVGTIGRTAIVSDEKLIAFQRSVAILRSEKLFPSFLLYLIQSQNFQHQLQVKKVVSAQPGVYLGDIGKIKVNIPEMNEQKKISDLLLSLDKKIQLQQQKIDLLQEQKKGFLQKMFPKAGETQPEMRFDGFTGEWEDRNFFDNIKHIIDFRGRTPKKLGLDWSPTGYLALSALNVKNGYIDFKADAHYGNQELYDKWMNGNELYKGQVLFTTEAPMGNVAQVPDSNKYILSQRTIAFNVDNSKITNDFLAVLLSSPKTFNELSAFASGGTAKGVSQKSLKKLNVVVPKSLEEQQKISTFFKKLDENITRQQQKLKLIEKQKQGFMQQMFI